LNILSHAMLKKEHKKPEKAILRISLILFFTLIYSCNTKAPSMFEKVRHLNPETLNGSIKAYHVKGYKNTAESTLNLLKKSIHFYEEIFDVRQSFALAVKDSSNWK
jgi:hypothetical protein